ncbi:MAG: hypothetical protein E7170_01685 [Firmicutes bacterium]|nr:hypothetical protein [Bacillota bacterium]
MQFNFNKITSIKEFKTINNIELTKLNTLASIEKDRINSKIINTFNNKEESIKSLVNINYNYLNQNEKNYISANIMYDSEKIIKTLLDFKIDYILAKAFAIRISEMKQIYTKNPNDIFFTSKYAITIMSVLHKFCFLIRNQFKTNDDYMIINKLICISLYEEELYKKLENQKMKKIQ